MWKDGGKARKTRNNYQRLPKWNRLLTTVTIPFDPPESGEGRGQGHRQSRDGDSVGDKQRKGEMNMERSKTTEQGAVLTELNNEPRSYPI